MKYRFPVQYAELSEKLKATEEQREAFISKFNAPIIEALKRDHINFEISGRVKSLTRSGARCSANRFPSRRFTTCSPSGSSSGQNYDKR